MVYVCKVLAGYTQVWQLLLLFPRFCGIRFHPLVADGAFLHKGQILFSNVSFVEIVCNVNSRIKDQLFSFKTFYATLQFSDLLMRGFSFRHNAGFVPV